MTIALMDLAAQNAEIQDELEAVTLAVLRSGRFVLGPEVEAFEREYADACGAGFCIAVNSGTSALHLALTALGIGPGDEVITTPMTFCATAAAIRYAGATPVYVDIDPATLNLDPSLVETAIGPHTRALLPVHLYGQPASMSRITALAEAHGLRVIEDACQAHLATFGHRKVGAIGDVGCFSFYPGKNLGAAGEGGAVITDDPALAHRIRLLRDWGSERKYAHELAGFNYRMDAIQAAILRVKLRRLPEWTRKRQLAASYYEDSLEGIARQLPEPNSTHVHHIYSVLVDDRDGVVASMRGDGVETGIHYPQPLHLIPPYADDRFPPGSLPVAERTADRQLSLPMHPNITPAMQRDVVGSLKRALSAHRSPAE